MPKATAPSSPTRWASVRAAAAAARLDPSPCARAPRAHLGTATHARPARARRAGKTLQTIAFLAHLKFDLGVCGPHLVLCPLSVLSSWLTEFKRFCPALRVVKLHSSDMHERERLKARILNDANLFDVVVTTYEMAKSPNMQAVLAHRRWWRYLVIDEGHVIKNEHSQISQAVRSFHYGNALLLTGTPLQNNMHELWALLNFLFPDIFPEASAFDSAFKLNSGAARDDVDASKLARAHAFLQPLMLRRVKAEVEKGLPEKLETVIECSLSEMQLFWCARDAAPDRPCAAARRRPHARLCARLSLADRRRTRARPTVMAPRARLLTPPRPALARSAAQVQAAAAQGHVAAAEP